MKTKTQLQPTVGANGGGKESRSGPWAPPTGQEGLPAIDVLASAIFSTNAKSGPVEFIMPSLVPISLLRAAPSYQRLLKWYRVRRIAAQFDARLFGAVTVARYPDGTLGEGPADGRHRVEALALLHPDQPGLLVPCFVIPVADRHEEALLFERLNRERTAVSTSDVFFSRLDREDPKALDIRRRVEACGWQINPHAQAPIPWNTLVTTHAVEEIYDRSPADVTETLDFLSATWPEQSACRFEKVLVGVAQFIRYYQSQAGWDEQPIRDTLSRISLRTITHGLMYHAGSSKKRAQAYAHRLAEIYNENRRKGDARLHVPVR